MWETLQKRIEWNNTSNIWIKRYSTIKLDNFAAHLAQHCDQKLTPQQCRDIMTFEIFSTVNPIKSMKTWSKSSCNLCMRERLEIISCSQSRYEKLINAR